MIDKNRINSKIIFIKERLSTLSELAKLSKSEFKADNRNIASACYWLQTAVESMIDVAQHIAVKKNLIRSKDVASVDFFEELYNEGVISKESLEKYRLMIRFRNRIVHLYQEVSQDEVFKIILDDLDDFKEFIKEIGEYVNIDDL